ncbi:helix-turn-helix domain-containing protein [Rhodococcus hoagii]|nr:helix-turn-helix domain-containing protein [Prescottella equi]
MASEDEWKQWELEALQSLRRGLRDAREAAGLSQADLAKAAGISKGSVMNLESEKPRVSALPGLGVLIRLATALNVPPVSLIYPNPPAGEVEPWPGHKTRAILAAQWFSGELTASQASDYLPEFNAEQQDQQYSRAKQWRLARELEAAKSQHGVAQLTHDPNGPRAKTTQSIVDATRRHLVECLVDVMLELKEPYVDVPGIEYDIMNEAEAAYMAIKKQDG